MVKEKFDNEKKTKTFRRIDENHPLNIFLGYNDENKPTMIITLKGKKIDIESSHLIEIKLYRKDDKHINLSFSLLDGSVETIFYKFCEDIIESSRNIGNRNALNYIISRWNSWRLMFKKDISELLNEKQISGLLGELIFLRQNMIKKYGEDVAISSWMGPEKAHKDFEVYDTWYEVKTIKNGALTIKISSVEQLDSPNIGHLFLIVLEKTNENNNEVFTLNNYINTISYELMNFENQITFRNKLLLSGYCYNEEYDKYSFRVVDKKSFIVNNSFPKIKKEDLGNSIVKASYEILIDEIDEYKEIGE